MYTPEKETACPDQEQAADEANEAGNLSGKDSKPSSMLIAEANAIAASIPSMMTRKRKHFAASRFLDIWLQALAAGRQEQAV